jgi:hypothetical protein
MKISEILREEEEDSLPAEVQMNLLGVLEFLHSRDFTEPYSTNAVINMVQKTGVPFDFDTLKMAYEKVPAVQNILSSIDGRTIKFKSPDSSKEELPPAKVDPTQQVGMMAKRALARRQ